MKPIFSFLLGLVLMGGSLAAPAQTAPAPKNRLVKPVLRPQSAASPNRTAYAHSFLKDTAAFRRSGRPIDGIRMRVQPIK